MDNLQFLMGIPKGFQDIPNIGQAKNDPMALKTVEIIQRVLVFPRLHSPTIVNPVRGRLNHLVQGILNDPHRPFLLELGDDVANR